MEQYFSKYDIQIEEHTENFKGDCDPSLINPIVHHFCCDVITIQKVLVGLVILYFTAQSPDKHQIAETGHALLKLIIIGVVRHLIEQTEARNKDQAA